MIGSLDFGSHVARLKKEPAVRGCHCEESQATKQSLSENGIASRSLS